MDRGASTKACGKELGWARAQGGAHFHVSRNRSKKGGRQGWEREATARIHVITHVHSTVGGRVQGAHKPEDHVWGL